MSTYTKRSDGRYMATIMLNGKRKYLYANTKKELDLKLSDMKINKSRGTISIYDNITFKQFQKNERMPLTKEQDKKSTRINGTFQCRYGI